MFLKGLGLSALATLVPLPAAARRNWTSRIHDSTRLLMDTVARITVAGDSRDQAEQGIALAFAEMERLIAVFDRHDSATPLAALNAGRNLRDAPAELADLIAVSAEYHRLSGGAFDITIQPVLDLLAAHGNPQGELRLDRRDLEAALALVGMDGVRARGRDISLARSGMGLTLDGIAKGSIVDRTAAVLEANGLFDYLINAGGDIRCRGEKRPGAPWMVAVEDPARRGGYPAVLALRQGAVATSGVYERYFDRTREHNHLLAPASGKSPEDCLSVTVTAQTVTQADALATAVAVMPGESGLRLVESLPGCACLILRKNGGRTASSGWRQV
jgi:thiamine biosynthesis lipoprotein